MKKMLFERKRKMEKVKEVLQFLEDSKDFYVSTVDGNKPRVRPFSGIHEFEGKLYMPIIPFVMTMTGVDYEIVEGLCA